jgi:Ankyrin repeat
VQTLKKKASPKPYNSADESPSVETPRTRLARLVRANMIDQVMDLFKIVGLHVGASALSSAQATTKPDAEQEKDSSSHSSDDSPTSPSPTASPSIEQLIDYNTVVVEEEGLTALHLAAQNGFPRLCLVLLKAGLCDLFVDVSRDGVGWISLCSRH